MNSLATIKTKYTTTHMVTVLSCESNRCSNKAIHAVPANATKAPTTIMMMWLTHLMLKPEAELKPLTYSPCQLSYRYIGKRGYDH